MNYLKQIIAFDKWEELHPLTDKAYRLWFKLMAIANASGWDEWLSVPLLKLKSELHTPSDQTVMNARNCLEQAGRIQVKKGKHGKAALYRIVPFPEENGVPSGVLNGVDRGVRNGEGSGVPSGVHDGEDRGTYYKQNKTKPNKTDDGLIDGARDVSDNQQEKSNQDKPLESFKVWEENWGFPSPLVRQDLSEWIGEFGDGLVAWAIKSAVRRAVPARSAESYLTRVFSSMKAQGVKTVEDAEKRAEEHRQQVDRERKSRQQYRNRPNKRETLPDWAKDEPPEKSTDRKAKGAGKPTKEQLDESKRLMAKLKNKQKERANS